MQSAYDDDDEDDDDDDELDNSESYEKPKKRKDKNKNIWDCIKILLQPTSNWGPASRNSFTPSKTLTPSSGNDCLSFRMSMNYNIHIHVLKDHREHTIQYEIRLFW